jgi:hypothetical protein
VAAGGGRAPARRQPGDQELREVKPGDAAAPKLPTVYQGANRAAPTAPAPVTRPEPTPQTRQLVASLAQLDVSRGAISPEQAEGWKQSLQELSRQGAAAVPAIREFLERNLEHNYAGLQAGQLLGQPSLRTALIDTLQQIGGPEATGLMVDTLRATTLPTEIAQLARNLEQQAPGQYRQETLNAVREVLDMAGKGQLAKLDVGPLFQALQTYGDASTASELAQRLPQWRYYATISLAGLETGQGVPALIQQVQDPATRSRSDFSFQMLAQVATQYPEAGTALIEQARLGQIPETAWAKIASGLAGDQYQVGRPPAAITTEVTGVSGTKTYHIESGNQNFFSVPFSVVATKENLEERRAIIAQLLAVTSEPAAVRALQGAASSLASVQPAGQNPPAPNPSQP